MGAYPHRGKNRLTDINNIPAKKNRKCLDPPPANGLAVAIER